MADVGRRFERRYGVVLGLSYARVRQAIHSCVNWGLLEVLPPDPEEQQEPKHQHFRVTPAGARAYRAWALEPPTPPLADVGQRLLVARRDIAAMLAVLESYEDACRRTILELPPPDPESGLAGELIHERQREDLEAGLRWAEVARVRVVEASAR